MGIIENKLIKRLKKSERDTLVEKAVTAVGSAAELKAASASVLGAVKIGDNVDVTSAGVISVPVAAANKKGVVKIGDNISVDSGTISVPVAAAATAGVVKVGTGLTITDGVLSIDAAAIKTALDAL